MSLPRVDFVFAVCEDVVCGGGGRRVEVERGEEGGERGRRRTRGGGRRATFRFLFDEKPTQDLKYVET